MNNPVGVSPSKGKQGTTRGKEKIVCVVPCFPVLGLTPSGLFMGLSGFTWTQTRVSNLTKLNTHKQRTDKLCLIDVANEFAGLNENRTSKALATFKESDLHLLGLA